MKSSLHGHCTRVYTVPNPPFLLSVRSFIFWSCHHHPSALNGNVPQRIQMPLHFIKRFFFQLAIRFGWSRRLVIPISCHLILPPYVTPNSIECQYFIAGGRAVGIYPFLVGRSQFPYCFQCKNKPFSTLKAWKSLKNEHSARDSFGCQVWQVFRYSYHIVDGVGVEDGVQARRCTRRFYREVVNKHSFQVFLSQ